MRGGKIVCQKCRSELDIRWIRPGKMIWLKEGSGTRNGLMLRFFCPKCRKFRRPYPPGYQTKVDNWK